MAFPRKYLWALLVPAAAAAVYFLAPPRSPVDALPADALATLTVDADALRASSFGPLFQDTVKQFVRLPAGCDVDLSQRADVAAMAIAEGKPELGLALSGKLTEGELLACKAAFQKPEAGTTSTTQSEVGSFHVASSDTLGKKMHIAWSRRGPLVLGIGDFALHMLAAVDGTTPRTDAPGNVHGALRASLTARAPTRVGALLTLRPSPKLREDFLAYVPEGSFLERVKPLATVSALGIALVPGVKEGQAEILVEATCDDENLCEKVKDLVLKQRFDFGKHIGVRLAGLGPLLDNLTVERSGKTLKLRTHDSAEALVRAFAQAKSFLALPDDLGLGLALPGNQGGKVPAPTLSGEPIPRKPSP